MAWHGLTTTSGYLCGVCNRHMEDNERFVLSGWLVHRRCAVEGAEGAAYRGDDRFEVAIIEGTGPPRRRAFLLTEIVPRIHMRFDSATHRGAHQQRQLEMFLAISEFGCGGGRKSTRRRSACAWGKGR